MAKKQKDSSMKSYQKLNIVSMGAKGGTGKTTFMVSLIDWFQSNNVPVVIKDLDDENEVKGGLKNYYDIAEKIDAHSRDALDVFFTVMDVTECVVIADMGAGQGQVTMNWFAERFDLAAEYGIGFLFVGMVTDDPASVASVLEWAATLRNRVHYLIVLNEMSDPHAKFKFWHESDQAIEFCEKFHPTVLKFDSRPPEMQGYLSNESLTLRHVVERNPRAGALSGFRHFANAQRLRRKLFQELDRIIPPLLPEV